jgi:hypothetical protein
MVGWRWFFRPSRRKRRGSCRRYRIGARNAAGLLIFWRNPGAKLNGLFCDTVRPSVALRLLALRHFVLLLFACLVGRLYATFSLRGVRFRGLIWNHSRCLLRIAIDTIDRLRVSSPALRGRRAVRLDAALALYSSPFGRLFLGRGNTTLTLGLRDCRLGSCCRCLALRSHGC